MKNKIIFFIYGVFIVLGGCIGLKHGSETSYLMSLAIGGVVFMGTYLLDKYKEVGYCLITYASSFMLIIMFLRILNTANFMPYGFICLVSFFIILLSVNPLLKKVTTE